MRLRLVKKLLAEEPGPPWRIGTYHRAFRRWQHHLRPSNLRRIAAHQCMKPGIPGRLKWASKTWNAEHKGRTLAKYRM